jgi:single-stranded-DNA-specific exonuclease
MVIDHHKRTGTPGPHLREINQQLHAGAQENGYSAAVLSLMLAEHVASHVPPLGKHLTELRVLAGLSAMADMVSMRSIASRFAARQCLLNTHSQDGNLGLRYLAKAMNLDHVLTSSDVGFRIAPLFNAAGRMSQAGLAIRLFNSVNVNEAASLTDELKEWNEKRRERQMEVENQAMPRFQQGDRVLLEFDQQWHPGVVGPAAGRLVERLGVPVFLGGYLPDMDMFTFSARSVDGINIHEMLCEAAKGLPISFGGHAVALGMKVAAIDAERVISDLRNRLNSILIKRKASVRQISAYLSAETVGDRNFRQVCELEPFGVDNPAPFFCIRDVRMELKPMAHSQVDASGTAVDSHGRAFDVVVFRNHALASQRHIEGDVIGQLIESRFAGQRKVKLNVHDIVPKKERVHSGHSV